MERQLAGTIEADDLSHTAGKDRPAIIAWVSRQGAVVIQAPRDFTVQTV